MMDVQDDNIIFTENDYHVPPTYIRRKICPRNQKLLQICKGKLSQPLHFQLRQSPVLKQA